MIRLDKEDKTLLKNQRILLCAISWVKNMSFASNIISPLVERFVVCFLAYFLFTYQGSLHSVLHNLLYATYVFGEHHTATVQLIWKMIATKEENIEEVVNYILTFGTNIRNGGLNSIYFDDLKRLLMPFL